MYCSNCASEIIGNSKFCSNCGAAAPTKTATQAPSQPMYTNAPPPPQANPMPPQPTYRQAPTPPPQNVGYNYVPNPQQQPPAPKKKKKGCGCLIAVLVVIAVLFLAFLLFPTDTDETTSSQHQDAPTTTDNQSDAGTTTTGMGSYGVDLGLTDLRDFYTTPIGDGSDVNTVMVYLIGSDLESDGGFATIDLYEMLDADIGDNLNLIIMTGGSLSWEMGEVSSDTCQYWQIKNNELIPIEQNLGQLNMTDPGTLTGFINDTAAAFPADRYSLILWDHGGGTISGFGHDENFPDSTLTLANMEEAFSMSNVKFDFVGFDACLMATAETAFMLEPYADYLIASQELEPGIGWSYTGWLSTLNQNPSMSTVDIAVNIIDDFVVTCENDMFNPAATLSVIELRQMPYTYQVMTDFFANSTIDIVNNEYRKISQARSNAKDFGDGGNDQIDLVDYVMKSGVEGGDAVIAAVNSAVKYYYNSYDVSDSYGMAMYFPFEYISHYSYVQDILHNVGYSAEYTEFFNIFISAMSGGQAQYSRSSGVEPEQDYSSEEWYNADTATAYEESYDTDVLVDLVIDEKGDDYVLSLSDEQWEEIIGIELQVLLDDGEGYIDLGSDNVYEFDDDGDLLIEFDYTWVAIDGNIVPFYAEEEVYISENDWYTYGMVPAFLNDEYIEIMLYWDDEKPTGYVAGYRKHSETGEPVGKGLFDLQPGDVVEWVIDYYDYEGNYNDYYVFNDPYTVPSTEPTVSYEHVGDMDAMIYFVLTDIYNNTYETEAVLYSDY